MSGISVWMLGSSKITVSDGASLSGQTQGDGSHLVGKVLVLNARDWTETRIADDDKTFDDNDGSQKLDGTQVIDGMKYAGGTVVEAEYRLTLRDAETGKTWQVIGYNINNSKTSFATVEGLAFIGPKGGFPPTGHKLEVVSASEGPGSGNQKAVGYGDLASPPCFTAGTRIRTPAGEVPVEALKPGDRVDTLDSSAQPLVWVGSITVAPARMAMTPAFRPIRIGAGALGPGCPARDLVVSPQHRMVVGGWRAEMLFGAPEVLIAAKHLVNGSSVTLGQNLSAVTYIHLLFSRHQVIWAEGSLTESFQPLGQCGSPQADELAALFPALRGTTLQAGLAARPCLRGWEAALLIA